MQYIILLRGINIGGRKIKMEELRCCFEAAGYNYVATVLQTGNVILESHNSSEKLLSDIEKLLEQSFHYPAKVIVLTPKQIHKIVENYPFKNYGIEFHRYAVFTEQENAKALLENNLGKLDESKEDIRIGDGVVYWRVLKGYTLDSDFGKIMNKTASKYFVTNRNVNTLEKILKKCKPIG